MGDEEEIECEYQQPEEAGDESLLDMLDMMTDKEVVHHVAVAGGCSLCTAYKTLAH